MSHRSPFHLSYHQLTPAQRQELRAKLMAHETLAGDVLPQHELLPTSPATSSTLTHSSAEVLDSSFDEQQQQVYQEAQDELDWAQQEAVYSKTYEPDALLFSSALYAAQ